MIHFLEFVNLLTNNNLLLLKGSFHRKKYTLTSLSTKKPKINTFEAKVCYQPYKRLTIDQLLQVGFNAPMDSSKPSTKTKSHFRI